jgi:hypothetical protein
MVKTKKDMMDRESSMHGRTPLTRPRWRLEDNILEDLKGGRLWTGLIWLMIGTGDLPYEDRNKKWRPGIELRACFP